MEKKIYRLTSASAAALVVAGCGGGGGGGAGTENLTGDQSGRLSFAVTDAPVDDAHAVVIAMTEFELKPADEPPFRIDVIGAPRELDLLDFTDGETAMVIEDEEVPAGDYEWLRIFFDGALSYIQLDEGGETYPIVVPSGDQTGYKLQSGFTVPANGAVEYVLDFDVRRSVVEPPGLAGPNGEPRTFLLKPTVRMMNAVETGGVSGTVADTLLDLNNARCAAAESPLEGNAVYVFEGAAADVDLDDVADEDEEDDGRPGPLTSDVVDLNIATGAHEYHLMYLLPGRYTLAFTCSASADGASDADYPAPSESGFDFDAVIEVDVVEGEIKSCDITGEEPEEVC